MTRNRNIDAIKTLLLFLVCIGHMMQCADYEKSVASDAFYRLIYTFHVPAFTIISGYFSSPMGGGKLSVFVFPILEIIFYGSFLWNLFAGKDISIEMVFIPAYHLWYLMSLIWWRLLISLFHVKIQTSFLIISIIVSVMSIKIGTDILSIGMTLKFLPFFLIGYMARIKGIEISTIRIKIWHVFMSFICVYLLYLLFPWLGSITHNGSLTKAIGYKMIDILSFYIFALFLSLSFISLMNRVNWPKFLSDAGQNNMLYYVYHGFIRFVFLYVMIEYFIEPSFILLLCFSAMNMAIIWVLSHFEITYVLMQPLSYIYLKLSNK